MNKWQPISTAPKDGTLINVRAVYVGDSDVAAPCFEGLAQWRTMKRDGYEYSCWMQYGSDKRIPGRVMGWCYSAAHPQALPPTRTSEFVWVIPAPGRSWTPAERYQGNRYLLPGIETAFDETKMFAIGETFKWSPPVDDGERHPPVGKPSTEPYHYRQPEPHETPRDVLKRVTLSLQAAITMLEQGDKSVAASDVIFDLLMDQFRNSLYAAKELLK